MVLLHGWPQTWYAWRKVMPGLAAAGYRVMAIEYRGAGDSSRPAHGYDEATMAGDIRGLLDAVGAQRMHIVARDIGLMVGYALAAQWPQRVASMTMLDVPLPGTGAWEQAKGDPQTWHFGLHQQRDVAETLVTGREYDSISTFYRARTQVAGALTDDDLAVYARAYGAPGALRAGFELYRAFDEDEERFAELMEDKLPMPVPAFGGELDSGAMIPDMAREVAADVQGVIVPGGGHWTPEENPGFLLERLLAFLPPPGPVQHDTSNDHEQ
ncbi:alpha/beta fold hydrolase [Streptomyces sp. NPDC004059]